MQHFPCWMSHFASQSYLFVLIFLFRPLDMEVAMMPMKTRTEETK